MRSFYGQILQLGGSYQAQYITQEQLEEIINSDKERGILDENGDIVLDGTTGIKENGRADAGNSGFFGNAGNGAGIRASSFPNPANPTTTITFNIEKSAHINLSIYNVTGRLVKKFDLGYQEAAVFLHLLHSHIKK